MTKVIDWINAYSGDSISPNDNDIGIEIEVEGERLPSIVNDDWRVDRDGSLRGESYEYVSRPMKEGELDDVMSSLAKAYKTSRSNVHESIRAGVHVHYNVQDFTPVQLFTMATAYFLVEDALVRWCGSAREGNHFCLRSKDGEYVLFKMKEAADSGKIEKLDTDVIRYCSLNLFSLFKYGTIEFRAMRGTADLDAIKTWARMICSIANRSKLYTDPVDIIMSMGGDGEEALLRNLLPSHHSVLTYRGYQDDIRESARRLQFMAHTTDWSKFTPTLGGRRAAIPEAAPLRIDVGLQPPPPRRGRNPAVEQVVNNEPRLGRFVNQWQIDELVRMQQQEIAQRVNPPIVANAFAEPFAQPQPIVFDRWEPRWDDPREEE